jgi:hypothetical protein
MSGLTTGVTGAIALLLISGAAQFAMGRDLSGVSGRLPPPKPTSHVSSSHAPQSSRTPDLFAVNRGAKADRAIGPSGSPALLQTVSLKLDGVPDRSVLVRMPVAGAAPSTASSPAKRGTRRAMTACEPVVSVLTEVARLLQPGRCVT